MASDTDCYEFPKEAGLYSPEYEKAACGVGFIVNINGARNNEVLLLLAVYLCCNRNFIVFLMFLLSLEIAALT